MNNILTPYQADILAQPQALRDTLDYLGNLKCPPNMCAEFQNEKWSRIVLTGMGSSYYALYPLYLRFVQAGKSVWLIETSELIHYQTAFLGEDTLIIAASQSGASAEIVRLLQVCKDRCAIIGITNNEHGPLAVGSDFQVLTRAGDENTVTCKTYVTALAAQTWLGDHLLGGERQFQELADIPQQVEEYLKPWRNTLTLLHKQLEGTHQVYLTGRGASIAAVGTGGLILKESTHVASEGLSSAAFRHGPFEMVSSETFVLVFAGPEQTRSLNIKLVDDIINAGGSAELVQCGAEPALFTLPFCSDTSLPIMEILPVQMITLSLAEIRRLQAGKFRFGNKITASE